MSYIVTELLNNPKTSIQTQENYKLRRTEVTLQLKAVTALSDCDGLIP